MTIWQALLSGVNDSLSPFSIAVLLLFWMFLTVFCKSRREVVIYGIIFISGIWVAKFLLIFGIALDRLSSVPFMLRLVWLNYVFASMLIIYGILNLIDWAVLKFSSKEIKPVLVQLPFFVVAGNVAPVKRFWWVGVLVLALALVVQMLGLYIAEDSNFYFLLGYLFTHGENISVWVAIILYLATYSLLLIFLLAAVFMLSSKKYLLIWSVKTISWYRIFFSGALIAVGISFLMFIHQFNYR
ncbi:MAG: hypothetical protein HQL25_06025 [Candidatus Omnitrophica bacterium]|nr:hypothetical protein [Candidatus Omnitrophota bacterium]